MRREDLVRRAATQVPALIVTLLTLWTMRAMNPFPTVRDVVIGAVVMGITLQLIPKFAHLPATRKYRLLALAATIGIAIGAYMIPRL